VPESPPQVPEGRDTSSKRRRPVIVGAAAGAAAILVAAIAVAVLTGGGPGPARASKTAAPTLATGNGRASSSATTTGFSGEARGDSGVATRAAASSGSTTTTSEMASTTTTRPAINPAASTSTAVNMAAPAAFGPLLRNVWVDARPGGVPISTADVQSTLPGSVFYAEQAAIGTDWAISQFVPSAHAKSEAGTAAGNAVLAQFNNTAVFVKDPGKAWAYLGDFAPSSCAGDLPVPVLSAWGLCVAGS